MQKFNVINNSDRVIRTVEATGYRHVDGYFHFNRGDYRVMSVAASQVSIVEEVQDEK